MIAVDHDDFKWVSIDEMKNFEFAPADIPFIEKLRSKV
jgi:8-oxo-dGTP diphosphatase